VVRWPLGRKLLGLAGFSATPLPCSGFSGVGVGSGANDDSAPLSTADPDVAAWRAAAVYTFRGVEENDSSSSSSCSGANNTATEANGSTVANTTDTIGMARASAIEEVLAAWIAQNQALAAGNRGVNSCSNSGSNTGGDGGKEAAAALPAVAETKPQRALHPPQPPRQQHAHQLLVGGALHGPAGPAVDWLRALGLER